MSIFKDPYGVLTLNAMGDLASDHEDANENPFMEWGLATVSAEISRSPSTQKAVEVPMKDPL